MVGRDPLKGGFLKTGRRGDAAEKMTDAEAAASKIKVKVSLPALDQVLALHTAASSEATGSNMLCPPLMRPLNDLSWLARK